MIECNEEIKDIQNCIHFMWGEWEKHTDDGIPYIMENPTCLHPDREDTNSECEYLNAVNCKFFEEK